MLWIIIVAIILGIVALLIVTRKKSCNKQCKGKNCGPDGCGGSCGSCLDGNVCVSGSCCTPICKGEGKNCGPDGCGGSCGPKCSGGPQNQCLNGQCQNITGVYGLPWFFADSNQVVSSPDDCAAAATDKNIRFWTYDSQAEGIVDANNPNCYMLIQYQSVDSLQKQVLPEIYKE